MIKQLKTGGQILVDALIDNGVDVAYCVPGESFLEVLDAMYDRRDRLRLISCRHEGAAAFMAEAHAKAAGKPGVCFVTRGPGACNASIGLHTAHQDSSPKQLAALAGQHMKRVTMELGGHAPVIVCEDADIVLAVKCAAAAKFRNAGQVCISPTRFLVHNSVKDGFAQSLARYAEELKVGSGMADGTQMGPLANPRRLAAMVDFTQDAVQHGARVLAGGVRLGEAGNFWQPTVLVDVPLQAKVFNDEPFGPMAAIRGFTELDDAIAEANRLSFGLAGYAFTKSLRNADLLSRRVEVGMLWINMPAAPSAEMPFGGVKDSGYGSEGGPEAIDAYLNTRAVAVMNG